MNSNKNPDIDVNYVANLARLKLSAEETEVFQRQLNDIVEYVKAIEQVDVEKVEPTSHAMSVSNIFRSDERKSGLEPETALNNAPARDDRQFIVPRIV